MSRSLVATTTHRTHQHDGADGGCVRFAELRPVELAEHVPAHVEPYDLHARRGRRFFHEADAQPHARGLLPNEVAGRRQRRVHQPRGRRTRLDGPAVPDLPRVLRAPLRWPRLRGPGRLQQACPVCRIHLVAPGNRGLSRPLLAHGLHRLHLQRRLPQLVLGPLDQGRVRRSRRLLQGAFPQEGERLSRGEFLLAPSYFFSDYYRADSVSVSHTKAGCEDYKQHDSC